MKLRQKLAVVLASAMVVTAVPVVTSAASTNSMIKSVLKVKEDTEFWEASTAAAVRISFDEVEAEEVFYLTLKNSEWSKEQVAAMEAAANKENAGAGTFTLTRQGSKVVKVSFQPTTAGTEDLKVRIPLFTKVTGGEATVAIETNGSTKTSVTEGSWVYATTVSDDEVATVTVGSKKSLYKSGEIADITFKETFTGSIGTDTYFAVVDLNHKDFEFSLGTPVDNEKYKVVKSAGDITEMKKDSKGDYRKYEVKAEYQYGFGSETSEVATVYLSSDKTQMIVALSSSVESDSQGVIKLKDINIKSTEKSPKEGDVTISVSGSVVEANDLVVATCAAYGVNMSVEDNEVVAITGGTTEEVTFTLSENVDDSFTKDREITFTLDKGFFLDELDEEDETIEALAELLTVQIISDGDDEEKLAGSKLVPYITDYVTDEDDRVIGFELKLNEDEVTFTTTDIDELEITAEITADLDEEGDVTVKAEGRAIVDSASCVIANIVKPYTVTTEAATLKVGLQDQVAGKITIAETDKEMFQAGEYLYVVLPKVAGFEYEEEPTVKVTAGDLVIDEDATEIVKVTYDETTRQAVQVKIKRQSKTASTLEISDFEITVDRTVAEGSYDVVLTGAALAELEGAEIEVEDFLVVGTKNTEDLTASNGLAKGTATFVIGEAKYTMNGTEKAMDAASYIQDPGYTMIPVRYVAEAFGVSAQDILFSNGTATIFAGTRTIQLTSGSNVAIVNGAAVTMGTKVVIKDGRTYAPVGEVARILGISTEWDSASKTATFKNN